MGFEVVAIGGVAAALGVLHVLLATPIFESAGEDGEVTGDLAPRDQPDPDLSELELESDDDDAEQSATV